MTLKKTSVLLAALLCVQSLPASTLSEDPAAAVVGEVTFVLGKAHILQEGGRKQEIRDGALIKASDTIETGSNGVVHILFVDTARVAVRSSSRLEIVHYQYNPESPSDSVVKFNLMEGVSRAISGEAAKSARQSFRLNTPIAAIGVRGTDFAVSASQQSVRALVNEGAIVVAPFSSNCTADSLGPCNVNALELAGGGNQFLELNAGALEAVLRPMPETSLPDDLLDYAEPMVAETGKTQHEEEGGSELYADSVSNLAVNKKIESSSELLEPPAPEPIDFTPAVAVASAELVSDTQLVWGRWTENRSQEFERITVSYDEAFADGREATVGNNRYALTRAEAGSKVVKPGLGVVGFELTQAQVTLTTQESKDLMKVTNGVLNIDFDQNLFNTSLDLSHSVTGDIQFVDNGRLFSGGYFRNLSDGQTTAGAVSLDGTEAGYAFEKSVDEGKIEGITLWGAKP